MLFRITLSMVLAGWCMAQDSARMVHVVQSYASEQKLMGSVLVARGSQVIFSKGYGSADLEWAIPNAPSTKFRLGSVTKQFTAASVLLLEERGKLRRMIEETRAGKPDHDRMSAGLAAATRQQLPQLQARLNELGALQSMTFKGVGPGGADIYEARFEKGTMEYRIWLDPDGKIESANVRPL